MDTAWDVPRKIAPCVAPRCRRSAGPKETVSVAIDVNDRADAATT